MIMTRNYIYSFFFIFLGVASVSCSEDLESTDVNSCRRFEVTAAIENKDFSPATRVETYYGDGQDNWSFSRFSEKKFIARPLSQKDNSTWEWEEALGFYSNRGNNQSQDGKFVNEKMWYTRSLEDDRYATFISTEMDVNLNDLRSGGAAYFPYVEDIETTGLELRWVKNDPSDNLERCIDGLIMRRLTTDGTTVSGMNFHFYHAFSEMVIVRGEGFDKPKGDEEINVFLTEGYSHAVLEDYQKVEENQSYYKNFKFQYNEDYSLVKSKDECKKWGTWKGNYSFTQSGTAAIVKDAWFVLLPGGFDANRPSVDYIEIYDNYGTLHKITDFNLYNNDGKRLNWNERYILEIKMEGLVPTCNPVLVEPWGEDVELAQRQATGISTASDFQDFVTAYNGYANDRTSSDNTLKKYGDVSIEESTGEKYWHFYINDDFEFSDNNPVISLLHQNDIIDGLNNKVSGITGTFIKELNGSLQDINLVVNIKEENKTGSIGPIETINGGTVTNSTVYGTINCPKANVGMLAGTGNNPTVKNCIFSGLLLGLSTSDNIFGAIPGGDYTKDANSTSGVIFSNN